MSEAGVTPYALNAALGGLPLPCMPLHAKLLPRVSRAAGVAEQALGRVRVGLRPDRCAANVFRRAARGLARAVPQLHALRQRAAHHGQAAGQPRRRVAERGKVLPASSREVTHRE